MDLIVLYSYIPFILAFITGSALFYLLLKYGQILLETYQIRVIGEVDTHLKKSFIDTNPTTILFASLVTTVAFMAAFYLLLGTIGSIIGLSLGLLAPWIFQLVVRKKRLEKFVYQLPDALSSLAASMRAGGSLNKGLELLAKRQPVPLSQEFSLIVAENRLGRSLEESLKNMTKRLNCQELELLTTAITISKSVGGNLADTLDSLADTLREKAQIEGKIDALTATGRAQGWVVGLLPLGVGFALYAQQPEKMSLLFTELWGLAVLAVISVMMALAIWMIYKIVNIDV